MKTLANARDLEEILQRLGAIGTKSQRRWGRMTVGEMVCHLSDALQVSMGDRQTQAIRISLPRPVYKWLALWFPRKWPQGVPTVPECDPRRKGTRPAELERDIEVLRMQVARFAGQPRGYELQAHPIFGPMTEKEWMRWGYLHMDHHLRQFGA